NEQNGARAYDLVERFDRIRRVGVEGVKAGGAQSLRRFCRGFGRLERRQYTVEIAAHFDFSPSMTSRTSAIDTIGAKRRNKKKSVRKSPMVPASAAQSQNVGKKTPQ